MSERHLKGVFLDGFFHLKVVVKLSQVAGLIRNVINPAAAPRVAAPDAFCREPCSFKRSVFFKCLKGISATGGLVPAI